MQHQSMAVHPHSPTPRPPRAATSPSRSGAEFIAPDVPFEINTEELRRKYEERRRQIERANNPPIPINYADLERAMVAAEDPRTIEQAFRDQYGPSVRAFSEQMRTMGPMFNEVVYVIRDGRKHVAPMNQLTVGELRRTGNHVAGIYGHRIMYVELTVEQMQSLRDNCERQGTRYADVDSQLGFRVRAR